MDENAKRMIREWVAEMTASPGIPLWPEGQTPGYQAGYGQPEPSIVPFLLKNGASPRGAVIVCPGGGYVLKAPHEGRPVARMLNDAGIHAFVLDYRVAPYMVPDSLADVQRAIRVVRHRSAEWGIDPNKIGVLGFSAGGHLTVMASTLFDGGNPDAEDPVERESSRPDAQVPCYPLVSFQRIMSRKGSRQQLEQCFGKECTLEAIAWTFGDKNVRPDTPPAFLWGTGEDFLVAQIPPYLKALQKERIPAACHIFPHGAHGLGLAEDTPLVRQWPALCTAWLKELGF